MPGTRVRDVIASGLIADIPTPDSSNNGYLYFATDQDGGTLYRSDGTDWVQIAADVNASGGGSPTTPPFVGARVYNNGNQSCLANTDTTILFDTDIIDTDAFHSTVSNTGRLTIPTGKDGVYLLSTSPRVQGAAGYYCAAWFWKNGTTELARMYQIFTGAGISGLMLTAIADLAATDYIETRIRFYSQAGDVSYTAGQYPFFSCALLGT